MVFTEPTKKDLFERDPRLNRRHRAELRLKAYGILAITLALTALTTLLGTVLMQARGAVTESYITLPVPLDEATIDADGTRDPAKILRANFNGLTKDTLKDIFPQVTDRKLRRELYDLVSTGGSFELAEMVAEQPDLIGQTVEFAFLASDVTDLYLKGAYGDLSLLDTSGQLTIEVDGENARLASTGDDFTAGLELLRQGLLAEAEAMKRLAARQGAGAAEFVSRAAQSASAEEKAANEKEAEARRSEEARLFAEAEALIARATTNRQGEETNDDVPSLLVNVAGGWIKLLEIEDSTARGEVLSAPNILNGSSSDWKLYETELAESSRKVSDEQIVWIETLKDQGRIKQVLNTRFFTASDSREPELAGIKGAIVGTFLTMLVTFVLAFPTGVMAAIYLEEFAPKNRLTDFIEININNLAAVPSIVFGLLGLAVFLTVMGVPRSAPLAGGIVLALMTLPTIIIAARAAIKAVPPSIRDAALGVGASNLQASFHHVLPLAMPGILTGTIIGMAQALGETAPLIMIGMVAFIVEVPNGITDSATVLPVQIFRWSDFPEQAFGARTAAAICVLLAFLVSMNAIAIFLRRRFERRW